MWPQQVGRSCGFAGSARGAVAGQGGGGLVVAAFLTGQLSLGGNQFAVEGFGGGGLGQLVGAGGGSGGARLDGSILPSLAWA